MFQIQGCKGQTPIWLGQWYAHTGRKVIDDGHTGDKLPQTFQDISPSEYPFHGISSIVYGPAAIVGINPLAMCLKIILF